MVIAKDSATGKSTIYKVASGANAGDATTTPLIAIEGANISANSIKDVQSLKAVGDTVVLPYAQAGDKLSLADDKVKDATRLDVNDITGAFVPTLADGTSKVTQINAILKSANAITGNIKNDGAGISQQISNGFSVYLGGESDGASISAGTSAVDVEGATIAADYVYLNTKELITLSEAQAKDLPLQKANGVNANVAVTLPDDLAVNKVAATDLAKLATALNSANDKLIINVGSTTDAALSVTGDKEATNIINLTKAITNSADTKALTLIGGDSLNDQLVIKDAAPAALNGTKHIKLANIEKIDLAANATVNLAAFGAAPKFANNTTASGDGVIDTISSSKDGPAAAVLTISDIKAATLDISKVAGNADIVLAGVTGAANITLSENGHKETVKLEAAAAKATIANLGADDKVAFGSYDGSNSLAADKANHTLATDGTQVYTVTLPNLDLSKVTGAINAKGIAGLAAAFTKADTVFTAGANTKKALIAITAKATSKSTAPDTTALYELTADSTAGLADDGVSLIATLSGFTDTGTADYIIVNA